MKSTDELRRELHAAEEAERMEREAVKAGTPPVFRYSLRPAEQKGRFSDPVYDPSCRMFRLWGECVNREAARAAGWSSSWDTQDGGMDYVFNSLSGLLVCAVGGGTIYVSDPWDHDAPKGDAARTMGELSAFLVDNPEGGDVTAIVEGHRERTSKKRRGAA